MNYKDYYLRTIKDHTEGLKLVLGPTGLGKTYGFREAVAACINQAKQNKDSKKPPKKFVYITSRHQLIKEQEEKFNKKGLKVAYLKSQRETIEELLKKNKDSTKLESLVKTLEKKGLFKIGTKDNEQQIINQLKKRYNTLKGSWKG